MIVDFEGKVKEKRSDPVRRTMGIPARPSQMKF